MKRVGFVGLGVMGGRMSRNVLRSGFPVVAYDIIPERIDAVAAAGATRAKSLADVARAADVIITMLPNSPEVREVVTGAEGLLRGARPGTTFIDMSTIEPRVAQEIAVIVGEAGCAFLDAPVSRGVKGAEQGTLSIMVGGDRAVFEQTADVLRSMGTDLFYVGGPGMGQVAKLVNNTMAMVNIVTFAEAIVMGVKSGADPQVLLDIVTHSSGDSYSLRDKLPPILQGRFEAGFQIDLAHKDLTLALTQAGRAGVPMAVTAVARELFEFARAEGYGSLDARAVIRVLERVAGVEVRTERREG